MIVRHFLDWVRTAPAGQRAEATGALARAYLYSDLSPDDAAAAEGALLMLLDDASPLVRRALADAWRQANMRHPRSCWRSPPISRRSQRLCWRCRHFLSMPTWSMQWRPAAVSFKPRSQAARRCHARWPPPLPKLAPQNPVWCCWKTATPKLRHSRSIGSSSVMVIWRRSASRCWNVRYRCGDAADAGRQAVGDAGRFRRRAPMARCRPRPAHRPRGLREGYRRTGCRYADHADAPADPSSACQRPVDGWSHFAGTVVRQCGAV